jgi:tyrosine-protein kinase Etk/Wzc
LENSTQHAPEINWKNILSQLYVRKFFLFICLIIGLLLGILISVIPANIYQTSSVLQIEKRSNGVSLPSELIGSILSGETTPSSSFTTELHIIKSRLILKPVAQELGLFVKVSPKLLPIWGNYLQSNGYIKYFKKIDDLVPSEYVRDGEFLNIKNFSVPENFISKRIKFLSLGDNKFKVYLGKEIYEGQVGKQLNFVNGGQLYVSDLNAKSGRVFYITHLPTRTIVDQLASGLFISERRGGRQGSGIIDFVQKGEDPKLLVPILNSVIKTYQSKTLQRRSAEIDQSIDFILGELPKIRLKLENAKNAVAKFREDQNIAGELSVATQELLERIVGLENEEERLTYEIEEISKRVTSNHPDFISLNEEKSRIKSKLGSTRQEIYLIPKAEQSLALLSGDLASAQGLELQLVQRVEQLRILKASTVGNVRVLEPSEVYKKIGPNRLSPILLSLLFALTFSVTWIFIRNYFSNGIKGIEDITSLGVALFGTVMAQKNILKGSKSSDYLISLREPNSLIVEAFRGLRTALKFSLSTTDNKSILITSAAPGDGKSFVASNLAAIIASSGQKVLLVDADMRRGKLRHIFNVSKRSKGLSDILSDNEKIDLACYDTELDDLKFVPAGRYPPNPAEILESSRMDDFYSWAKNNFDIIIFDTPPVLAVADPIILDKYSGVNLIIVRHNVSHIGQLEESIRILKNSGVIINGAILNDFNQKNSKYGNYSYNYSYQSESDN